jgi:hypothetical protein
MAPNFKPARGAHMYQAGPGQRRGDDEVIVLVCEGTKPHCVRAFLLRMTHCTGVINSSLGKKYTTLLAFF